MISACARMTLRMKSGEHVLKARPYRSPEALHLPNGGYPQVVAYKDAVDCRCLASGRRDVQA